MCPIGPQQLVAADGRILSAVDKIDLPCLPVNTTNYEHSLHRHEHASSLPSAARFLIACCPPYTAQATHSLGLLALLPGHDRWCLPAIIHSLPLNCYYSSPASQPASLISAPLPSLAASHLQRNPRRHSSPAARPSSPLCCLQTADAALDSAARGCCDVPPRYLHPQSHKAAISPVGPGRPFYNVPQLQPSALIASAPDCHQTARFFCCCCSCCCSTVFTTRRPPAFDPRPRPSTSTLDPHDPFRPRSSYTAPLSATWSRSVRTILCHWHGYESGSAAVWV